MCCSRAQASYHLFVIWVKCLLNQREFLSPQFPVGVYKLSKLVIQKKTQMNQRDSGLKTSKSLLIQRERKEKKMVTAECLPPRACHTCCRLTPGS